MLQSRNTNLAGAANNAAPTAQGEGRCLECGKTFTPLKRRPIEEKLPWCLHTKCLKCIKADLPCSQCAAAAATRGPFYYKHVQEVTIKREPFGSGSEPDTSSANRHSHSHKSQASATQVKIEIKDEPLSEDER